MRGDWWMLFNDPALSRLEPLVASANESLKQAEARFRQARALVALNRANYFPVISTSPSVTAGGGAGRNGTLNNAALNTVGRGTFTQFSLPIGVSWEPDFWGRIGLTVQNAVANAQASAADLENARLSLQADLAIDYFSLRGADMDLKLLESAIAAYEQALQLTVNRFNGGVASRADVVLAQTQLENTRAQATDLRATRAQFEHAIATLTGRAPADLSLAAGDIQGTPPIIPVAVPSKLLERRPDIAASERLVAATNANIGLARAAYFPNLALTASAGLASSSLASWFTWPSRFWSVGPALTQTLFDFGRRRAGVNLSEAAYDETVAAYRQSALTAFQEVEDYLAALRYLAEEAAQQDAAVRAAQESLALETERYKAGTVSYLDVLQTQVITLNSERAGVQILERRMIAAVNLIRALGGGWDSSNLPSARDLRSTGAKANDSRR